VSSSKALAGRTTASDAEPSAIRLEVSKTTSIDIEHIILITNPLGSVRKTVDPSVYSRQTHFLVICSILRLFFCSGLSHKINFWNCPSKAEWSLHQMVHDDITNTRVAARLYSATSIDTLCSKSVTSCLDTWRTSFNHSTVHKFYFLTLRGKNCQLF